MLGRLPRQRRAVGRAAGWRRAALQAPSQSHFSLPARLQVGKEKLSVRYTGPAQHDNDVGSIQVGAAPLEAAARICGGGPAPGPGGL
jgi:hypothetical protein